MLWGSDPRDKSELERGKFTKWRGYEIINAIKIRGKAYAGPWIK